MKAIARIFASRRSLGIAVLALLIAVRLSDPLPLEELRLRSFDWFQTIAPRSDTSRPVVIVDIDEASLSAYGQWPWPRTLVADLLTRLFEWKITAVAFDVIFPEPDRTSPNEAMKYFSDLMTPLARACCNCRAMTIYWQRRSVAERSCSANRGLDQSAPA
jgi:adenylate cyclase